MHRRHPKSVLIRRAALTTAILIPTAPALAGVVPDAFISATGALTADGAQENLNFNFVNTGFTNTFRTWAFNGGTNAAGDTISNGGIDSVIEVFNSSNTSLGFNDDRGGAGQRDSLLSSSGSSGTFIANLSPGTYRLNVTNSFLVLGDGHWAADITRSGGRIVYTGRTASNSTLTTLKFGLVGTTGLVTPDNAQVSVSGSQVLSLTGAMEARNGGGLLVSGGTLTAGSLKISQYATGDLSGGTTGIATNLRVESNGSLNYSAGYLQAGTFDIAGGRVLVTAGGSKLLRGGGLSITSNGTLDLADNDMLLTAATVPAVASLIVAARNGGAWNLPGLTSSTAAANPTTNLGLLSGAEYLSLSGTGTFNGVTPAAPDVLVKYTWNGDANLNGVVNFDDYVRIDVGFNTNLTGWSNGDFNYSGQVNFDDYVMIDVAFNTQSGTLGRAIAYLDGSDRSASGLEVAGAREVLEHFEKFGTVYAQHFLAAVPEPLAAGLIVPATLLARRRRRVNLAMLRSRAGAVYGDCGKARRASAAGHVSTS